MRRISLRSGAIGAALAAVTLTGCSDFRALFSAHADTAAEAAGMELSSERLAAILTAAGGRQRITREAAEFVAGTWVEYALLSQAVARGELPVDSASVAEAVWPEISELKGTHFHDTLMARRTQLSDSAADSLYRIADTRLLQHILFGLKPNSPPPLRTATQRKAEGTLTQVKGGADFAALALKLSEDPGSKADSGYLPPGPRGRYVPAFDSAGWALAPGQVSGLVETPFGFHIIRRPTLDDVRGRITDYLENSAGARLDSLFMDSLAAVHDIEVLDGAPAAMRVATESPDDSRRSGKALVSFKGGELTVQEYLRWVRALPPQYAGQLRQANDSMLGQFAKVLTQNVLLLRAADSAGIKVTPVEWAGLRQRYLTQLDTLKAEMELAGPDLTDSTISLDEREEVAALKVEKYFDGLVGGKLRLRPLPSALASLLREKLPYRIHDAGVNRAFELAQEQRAKADSAAGQGGMQPAPGPAPVPGAMPQAAPPAGRDSVRP
ncbi:MAG: peptidylprolyl isomerase [Gemmatimonadales bacterium]|nr:peptidylprolyl isomerase [Gemmatimonadales bacterium]